MQIKIKKLNKNNIDEVHKISLEQFEDESWGFSQFQECLSNKTYISFIALDGSQVVAFIIAQNLIDSINLLLIATKENYKKMGIASLLIESLIKYSEEKKIKIWLEVRKDNSPAINLYTKFGFKNLYERKNYYKDGSSALILERYSY